MKRINQKVNFDNYESLICLPKNKRKLRPDFSKLLKILILEIYQGLVH